MFELIASETLMYIASKGNELPHEAIARLTPITERDIEAIAPMFPGVTADKIQKLIRSRNISRNYGLAGFEIQFCAGHDFDIDAYVDSFSDDDELLVEAHITKYKKGSDRGRSIFKSDKKIIEDPEKYKWRMLSQFRMWKLVKEAHKRNQRYLQGQSVVATGRFGKFSESRVAKEIKTLGGVTQSEINGNTSLVLIGHDPDHAMVSYALEHQLETMHSHLFDFLVRFGAQNKWTPPVEFREENLTKHGKFIIRERHFHIDHGEFLLTGRSIAHITKDKERAQESLKRRSASHKKEFIDFPEVKGKRFFDIVELAKENELFLIFKGDGSEPRQSMGYAFYGEFLLFSECEEKAHKLALEDILYDEGDILCGNPEQHSDNPEALIKHIENSKGLKYDKNHCQIKISESTSPNIMVRLNKLLRKPIYQVKAVSPIDVMRYEYNLEKIRIL